MNRFLIPTKKGASLYCKIEEAWEQVLSRQIRCGQKFRRIVRRKKGVSREQREDLEATVKGSFGIMGIAQMEASIRAATGTTIKFEEMEEVEETIEVQAPKYGRYLLRYFQKKQLFHFEGVDSRWFSREPWSMTVERLLDEYYDDSRRFEKDPSCKSVTPDPPPDGLLELVVEGGKLTMAVPYRTTESGIEFTDLRLQTDANLRELMSSRAKIPSELLSETSRFLAGITKKNVDTIFSQPRPLVRLAPTHTYPTTPHLSGITDRHFPFFGKSLEIPREKGLVTIGKKIISLDTSSDEVLGEPVFALDAREFRRHMRNFPLIHMSSIEKKY